MGFTGTFRACAGSRQPISLVALCATMKPSPGRAALPGGTDMAGPSWLAVTFAAVVIVAGAYSASRLAISRLRGWATESDADALHAVMGAAMAGMLVPRLSVLPDGMWLVVFGIAAAWFGWRALRARGFAAAGSPFRLPVPHLIECVAMLYMLLPVNGLRPAHGGTGMAMGGMGTSARQAGGFPALAVILALFMLGYIVWTTDRLTTLVRARTIAVDRGRNPGQRSSVATLAAAPMGDAGGAVSAPTGARARQRNQAGTPVLAPKLAACGTLAMGITMGYMLIVTL